MVDKPDPFYDAWKAKLELDQQEEFSQLWRECEKELCRTAIKRHMMKKLRDGEAVGVMSSMVLQKVGKDAFVGGKEAVPEDRYTLVTIGAKEGIDPCEFIGTMPKVLKKAGLESEGEVHYSLEQRAEGDQQPYGWHIHALVKFRDKMPPSGRSRLIYQGFKKFLAGQNYVDLRPVKGCTEGNVLNYISGLKKEPDKQAKIEKDRLVRRELGIQDLFTVVVGK